MVTLTLTSEQVIELIKQLPQEQQIEIFQFLLTQNWANWLQLSQDSQERVRQVAAKRGQNWDAMTEGEREEFIDNLVHED